MPSILKEPIKRRRCPRCNAELIYEHAHSVAEKRWLCTNPVCHMVWIYRQPEKAAHSA